VLVENGIIFHCEVITRSQLRRSHQRMLRGSIHHHVHTSGRLIYTTDESLHEYYQDAALVGERDRQMLACYYGTIAVGLLHSVRKSYYAHKDTTYMNLWLLDDLRYLAYIEVALQGEIMQREVIRQAVRLNPEVFQPLVDSLLHGSKDLASLREIQLRIEAYLKGNSRQIFLPLLGYLQAEGEFRAISEIYEYLAPRLQMRETSMQLMDTCNFLVEVGLLQEISLPMKLTTKSRVTVDEPAYYYEGE
jgi:hypothetical protein